VRGAVGGQADDTPQAVQGRLRDYHEKTRPVLERFWAKEVIVAVDATGPVARVPGGHARAVGCRHVGLPVAADGHGSSETVGGSEPLKVTTC
jgi:hypothetical protein